MPDYSNWSKLSPSYLSYLSWSRPIKPVKPEPKPGAVCSSYSYSTSHALDARDSNTAHATRLPEWWLRPSSAGRADIPNLAKTAIMKLTRSKTAEYWEGWQARRAAQAMHIHRPKAESRLVERIC